MTRMKIFLGTVVTFCTLACSVLTASAQAKGTIYIKGSDKGITGQIRWSQAKKGYDVVRDGSDRGTLVPLRKVERISVSRPAGLVAAARNVRDESYEGPHIDDLKRIVSVYLMLEHDMVAAVYLAEAYLATGNTRQAAATCQKVRANRTATQLSADFLRVYWRTLLENQKHSTLQQEVKEIIETGPRPVAALAQLMRGDIDVSKGNYERALIDGYLRTVILFGDVRDVQPEALYKAARCFEELGESVNAEKMRKKLLAVYPGSDYSKKIQAGG